MLPSERYEKERALAATLRRQRGRSRKRRRTAALVYLVSGAAFGTCLYLARTRFAAFVAGHRWPFFVLLVALSAALFILATRFDADAGREESVARDIEDQLERLRRS